MTDNELKQQPRSVREEFENITNAEIDGDAKITALKTELAGARAKLRNVQEAHDNVRDCIEWLPSGIVSAEKKIDEIKGRRVSAIAAAMIADTENNPAPDFSADDELLAQLKVAELHFERLRLSVQGLSQQEKQARRAVELASNPVMAIEDRISQRRDALKLAEARRRHGYV